ncbi:hypothetical protein ABK040_004766 [Willaertia magna]
MKKLITRATYPKSCFKSFPSNFQKQNCSSSLSFLLLSSQKSFYSTLNINNNNNNPQTKESIKERRKKEQEFHTSKKYLHTTDSSLLKGYKSTIGLEIHAQISTKSKLFSSSPTNFQPLPNTNVSLFDVAFPGTLPIVNEHCIKQAIKTGLSLNANINKYSQFDRKHYFYPDLPLGYQITQQFYPLVEEGRLRIEIPNFTGTVNNSEKLIDGVLYKFIRIKRIQVEQDSGKSIHDVDHTLIDLNRAGNPLMEIITYPDLTSSLEAELFVKKLQFVLQSIGTCDGLMEEGSIRCDVNVSVYKEGEDPLSGTRCEVKNVSSANNIPRAIDFEIKRQVELILSGQRVEQQTRTFDAKKGETILLRSKENIPDYRFFPDPDLPYIELDDKYIEDIKNNLTELPDQILDNLLKEPYNLNYYDANVLMTTNGGVAFFKNILDWNNTLSSKLVANWIASELLGLLNSNELTLEQSPISYQQIGSIVDSIQKEEISGKIAKKILKVMFDEKSNELAIDIAEKNGWKQITDRQQITEWCKHAIDTHPTEVEKVLTTGKESVFQFLVAQVIKTSKGNASPTLTNQIMREMIQNKK